MDINKRVSGPSNNDNEMPISPSVHERVKDKNQDSIMVVSPTYKEFTKTYSSPLKAPQELWSPVVEVSHQTYEGWKNLEEKFTKGGLSPFFIQSLNAKKNPSSKAFVISEADGENKDEWVLDDSCIELKDFKPEPAPSNEDEAIWRTVDPSEERAKTYFIDELEKVCGSKEVVEAVYPREERTKPLTALKAQNLFDSLISLRDRAQAACKGDFSKYSTYFSLEIAQLKSNLQVGRALQEQLDKRFSPQKTPTK
ncbi:MAG: hypothetical protein K2W99_07830 [Chthoniobacterales bacterium]|nr:hypothetical protein [Chthoniobacterales bacterium]